MKPHPGPWHNRHASPHGNIEIAAAGYTVLAEPLCRVTCPRSFGRDGLPTVTADDVDRAEATAALITAAPDMLAALQDCLPDLERYSRSQGPGPDRRLEAALAAIAKATT